MGVPLDDRDEETMEDTVSFSLGGRGGEMERAEGERLVDEPMGAGCSLSTTSLLVIPSLEADDDVNSEVGGGNILTGRRTPEGTLGLFLVG